MKDGACTEYPHSWFFPERGVEVTRAKSVCDTCSVKSECLAYALTNGEHHGIWGGTSERERRRIRRRAA